MCGSASRGAKELALLESWLARSQAEGLGAHCRPSGGSRTRVRAMLRTCNRAGEEVPECSVREVRFGTTQGSGSGAVQGCRGRAVDPRTTGTRGMGGAADPRTVGVPPHSRLGADPLGGLLIRSSTQTTPLEVITSTIPTKLPKCCCLTTATHGCTRPSPCRIRRFSPPSLPRRCIA